MKIAILGGSGYIGSNLFYNLQILHGFTDIHIVDIKCGQNHDLTTTDGIKYLKDLRANLIYNLAGIVGEPKCKEDPVKSRMINVYFARLLRWYCEDAHIVQASSASILGPHKDEKVFPYATQKAELEMSLRGVERTIMFRFGTIYGIGYPGSIIRWDLLVNTMCKSAVDTGIITVWNGSALRPIIHIVRIVEQLAKIAVDFKNGIVYKNDYPIPLASENVTLAQIAIKIQKYIDCRILFEGSTQDKRDYAMPCIVDSVGLSANLEDIIYAAQAGYTTVPEATINYTGEKG